MPKNIYLIPILSLMLFTGCNNNTSKYNDIILKYNNNNEPLKADAAKFIANNIGERYTKTPTGTVYDNNAIDCNYLETHINSCFDAVSSNRYSKGIDPEDFREYILPYRYEDRYILENKTEIFKDDYRYMLSLDASLSVTDVIDSIQYRYHNMGFGLDSDSTLSTPAFIKRNIANCGSMTSFNAMLFSALGFAVTTDFTPYWGNMPNNHAWNILIHEGKEYPFDSFFSNYKTDFFRELYKCTNIKSDRHMTLGVTRITKAFREQFSLQDDRLTKKEKPENIPETFKKRNYKDVSSHYFETTDVEIKIPDYISRNSKFVWLSVFDVNGFIPVFWAEIKGDKAVFKDMGRDIVYFPVIIREGQIGCFSNAVYVDKKGGVEVFTKTDSSETVTLKRKFPHHNVNPIVRCEAIFGTYIEGGNSLNNMKKIVTLDSNITSLSDTILFENNSSYKYYRVVTPYKLVESIDKEVSEDDIRTIADIDLYAKSHDGILSRVEPKYDSEFEAIFDNNTLTYYSHSDKFTPIVINLSFENPINITAVNITPKNDKNFVYPGYEYELRYWENTEWRSLERKKSNSQTITYDKVPKNALLWLRCLSEGKEERIFRYIDGEQQWL